MKMRAKIQRKYQYRNLPCNIRPDHLLWEISGFDLVEPAGGVLEWCYDESDAKELVAKMQASGEFESLSYGRWENSLHGWGH